MSPSAADASNDGALTRSRIESWPTDHLRAAPAQWRTSARESLLKFERYQRSVNDTDWTGDGKDAAVDAADRDLNLVKHQHDVIEEMATTATDGHEAITAAKRDATNAISRRRARRISCRRRPRSQRWSQDRHFHPGRSF